jgi:hypothetical protein
MKDEKKDFPTLTQPSVEKKGYEPRRPIALVDGRYELEACTVELVKGQPIAGLTRQERDHLRFHGLIT